MHGIPYNPFFKLFPWLVTYAGGIPDLYWNIQSDEQRYRYLCEWMLAVVGNLKANNDHDIKQDGRLDELFSEFEEFVAHGFDDYYARQICEWVSLNLPCIVGQVVKFVQFGLTDSGRFVAFIPKNWDFLTFDTILAIGDDYGKLKINY